MPFQPISDTSFGGVEQQMPSSADMAVASPSPIPDKFLKFNNGNSTSPRDILAQYTPSPQAAPPDSVKLENGKMFDASSQPKNFQPIPGTNFQPIDTSDSTPKNFQPVAPADTSGPSNPASWLVDQFKSAGQTVNEQEWATKGQTNHEQALGLLAGAVQQTPTIAAWFAQIASTGFKSLAQTLNPLQSINPLVGIDSGLDYQKIAKEHQAIADTVNNIWNKAGGSTVDAIANENPTAQATGSLLGAIPKFIHNAIQDSASYFKAENPQALADVGTTFILGAMGGLEKVQTLEKINTNTGLTSEQMSVLHEHGMQAVFDRIDNQPELRSQLSLDLGDETASQEGGNKFGVDPKTLETDESGVQYDPKLSADVAGEEAKGVESKTPDLVDQAQVEEINVKGVPEDPTINNLPETKSNSFFNDDAMEQANRDQVDPANDDTRSQTRVDMTPIDYGRYTSQRELGFNSESATKRESIEKGIANGGLSETPQLTVDKVGDKWMVVDHDGRHRSDVLLKQGAADMPVRIIDDSNNQSFLKENPKELTSQDGGILKNPAFKEEGNSTVRQINKGTFGQSGSVRLFGLTDTPKEAIDFDRAKKVVGRTDEDVPTWTSKNKPPTQDMRARLGLGTGSWRTLNELMKNLDVPGHAIKVAAYLDDTMHLLKEDLERYILTEIHPHASAFLNYYKANTEIGFLRMYKTLKVDAPIALWFERNRDEWFNGTDYAPTIAQMKDKGMSAGSALAWDHLYKGFDAAWPKLVDFAKLKGIDLPPRIPGYLPHFTQGAWKVKLFSQSGAGSPRYIATIGTNSAKEAARLKGLADKLIDPKDPDQANWQTRIDPPKREGDMATMINGIFGVQEMMDRKGKMNALLQKLYEQASIGTLNSAMERQKTPQILHNLERISMSKDGQVSGFQLAPKEAWQSIKRLNQLMEAIPTMSMRAHFIRDTLLPLEEKGYFKNMPNLLTFTQEITKQFLHISDVSSSHIDNFFMDQFAHHGMDPNIPINAMRQFYSGASKFFLFDNIGYWSQQVLQKLVNGGAIFSAAANLSEAGYKNFSLTKAIAEDLAYSSRLIKLGSGESLHSYMQMTGHATPSFVENMDQGPKMLQDPIAKGAERYTRQGGARLGYTLFRQVLDEKQSLNAAGKLTDQINANYDSELGKGYGLSKEGQIMKPLTMFVQFTAHQFQFFKNQMQTMANATRAGNPRAMMYASGGLVYTMASMVALGGLGGIVGSQTYDNLIWALNNLFGLELPSTKKIARNAGDFFRTQNFGGQYANLLAKFAEFGIPSTLSGYDVSSSLRGPSIAVPEAAMAFIQSVVGYGALTARWLASQVGGIPITKKELGEANKTSPRPIRGFLEHAIRGNVYDSIAKGVLGGQGEMAPAYSDITLPGNYKRSPGDIILDYLGAHSVPEAANNTTLSLQKQTQGLLELQATRIVTDLSEDPTGPRSDELKKKLQQLALRGGADATAVVSAITKYQMNKQMTQDQRTEVGLDSIQSLAKWRSYMDLKKSEPK